MSPDLFEQIYNLTRAGESFAVAMVVRVEKPISAKPGDKAIIQSDGTLQGWVWRAGAAFDPIRHMIYFKHHGSKGEINHDRRNAL